MEKNMEKELETGEIVTFWLVGKKGIFYTGTIWGSYSFIPCSPSVSEGSGSADGQFGYWGGQQEILATWARSRAYCKTLEMRSWGDPCRLTRYPSSTLVPFLFVGLLIKAEYQEKGTLITKGLQGSLVKDLLQKQEEESRPANLSLENSASSCGTC